MVKAMRLSSNPSIDITSKLQSLVLQFGMRHCDMPNEEAPSNKPASFMRGPDAVNVYLSRRLKVGVKAGSKALKGLEKAAATVQLARAPESDGTTRAPFVYVPVPAAISGKMPGIEARQAVQKLVSH